MLNYIRRRWHVLYWPLSATGCCWRWSASPEVLWPSWRRSTAVAVAAAQRRCSAATRPHTAVSASSSTTRSTATRPDPTSRTAVSVHQARASNHLHSSRAPWAGWIHISLPSRPNPRAFLWPPCGIGQAIIFTFCVSRRRRKMYCGHARLCVCPRPYAHTTARTRITWGVVDAAP